MRFFVSLRFCITSSVVLGDCDVTNLEMGDVVATALISFLDKYLLFLSWEDWKFVSTITFLFSLCFWTLCGERCVHYWCFLFLSFIFKPYNFWRLNVYFCFSFDKDLPILAFSLSQAILLILWLCFDDILPLFPYFQALCLDFVSIISLSQLMLFASLTLVNPYPEIEEKLHQTEEK